MKSNDLLVRYRGLCRRADSPPQGRHPLRAKHSATAPVARRPPDRNHPYGHRKYETIAAAAIGGFLLIVTVEILETAWGRFRAGTAPTVTPMAFAVMIATIGVNLLVTRYERRAGERLQSEVLLADAMHTRSDVWTSLTVIAALAASWLGYPALDPIDQYGRLLRYVKRAGVNVNIRLVLVGAARPYFYRGERGRYADRLVAAASQARAAKRGLWGACRASGGGLGIVGAVPSSPAGAKCDANYAGGCVPIVTHDLDCKDIHALGIASVRVVRADPHRLDGDGDGYGCE